MGFVISSVQIKFAIIQHSIYFTPRFVEFSCFTDSFLLLVLFSIVCSPVIIKHPLVYIIHFQASIFPGYSLSWYFSRQVNVWYESTLVRPKCKYLLDSVWMPFLIESHERIRAITLFLWNTFSLRFLFEFFAPFYKHVADFRKQELLLVFNID